MFNKSLYVMISVANFKNLLKVKCRLESDVFPIEYTVR